MRKDDNIISNTFDRLNGDSIFATPEQAASLRTHVRSADERFENVTNERNARVENVGTSEGVKKEWETRRAGIVKRAEFASKVAKDSTNSANEASGKAAEYKTQSSHQDAERAHDRAIEDNEKAQKVHSEAAQEHAGDDAKFNYHHGKALEHKDLVQKHKEAFTHHSLEGAKEAPAKQESATPGTERKKMIVGPIFGHTFEQIKDMQQGKKPKYF